MSDSGGTAPSGGGSGGANTEPLDEAGGEVFAGRYRLGELLGAGGMADVHRGEDTRLGRAVAVKVFRPSAEAVGERGRFAAEARALAALSHPGLVTLFDAGFDGDRPYLVMQLVEGPTLADRLREGPLPAGTVRRVGIELAEALEHVHARGVVHRDLKPGNVLLDGSGRAYLADFGIARLVDATSVTASGALVGTAAYLAPEQVTNRAAGPGSDVYALGLVLLECLTGQREYVGRPLEVAVARVSRPPRLPESLPPGWRALLAAMTDFDPQRRPGAGEVAVRLSALGGDGSEGAVAAVAAPAAGGVGTPGRYAAVVLASIVLLGLVLVAYGGGDGGGVPERSPAPEGSVTAPRQPAPGGQPLPVSRTTPRRPGGEGQRGSSSPSVTPSRSVPASPGAASPSATVTSGPTTAGPSPSASVTPTATPSASATPSGQPSVSPTPSPTPPPPD